MLLKRCKNVMAKHIFQNTIKPFLDIYMCNYPLAFVIVNLINVHHTVTEHVNKTLLQRCHNV